MKGIARIHNISFKDVVLFFIPIIFYLFYGYVGFDMRLTKAILFVTVFILLLYVVGNLRKLGCVTHGSYGRYLWLLMLFVMISIVNAFGYWGQSPVLTFRAGSAIFAFLYFFVLKGCGVSVRKAECLVFLFATIYIILWLYALSQAPNVVFGFEGNVNQSRGFYRIVGLPGIHFVAFAFFICLQRSLSKHQRKRVLWLCAALVAYIVVFLSMTRSLFVGITVVALLFLLRKRLVLFVLLVLTVWLGGRELISINPVIQSYADLTKSEMKESKYGSRTVEFTKFMDLYPLRVGTVLFGNGNPHVESEYGKREESLKNRVRFHRGDSGIVGFYVTYGLAAMILIVALVLKVTRQTKPVEAMPCQLFFYYLLVASIAANTVVAGASALAIALYILEQYRIKEYEENSDVSVWRHHD